MGSTTLVLGLWSAAVIGLTAVGNVLDDMGGWGHTGALGVLVGLLFWFMRSHLEREREDREATREVFKQELERERQLFVQSLQQEREERKADLERERQNAGEALEVEREERRQERAEFKALVERFLEESRADRAHRQQAQVALTEHTSELRRLGSLIERSITHQES